MPAKKSKYEQNCVSMNNHNVYSTLGIIIESNDSLLIYDPPPSDSSKFGQLLSTHRDTHRHIILSVGVMNKGVN